MFAPDHDLNRALHNARVATRKRDFATVEKWMRIADHHLRMAERMIIIEKRRREVYGYINPPARVPRPDPMTPPAP